MNQNTRQRIVGTVMLLLVAAVLLPLLLDGDGNYPDPPLQPRIPEPPATPSVPETVNQRPEIEADQNDVVAIETPQPQTGSQSTPDNQSSDEAESPEATGAEPSLDSEGLPRGWSVRLGVFSSAGNVSNLVERLRQAGYAAYTRQVSSDQNNLTAVFVGPKVDRSEAEALQQELQQAFDLEGRVERYTIEEL